MNKVRKGKYVHNGAIIERMDEQAGFRGWRNMKDWWRVRANENQESYRMFKSRKQAVEWVDAGHDPADY